MDAPCKDFEYIEEGQSLTVQAPGINKISFWRYYDVTNKTEFMMFEAAQLHYHRPSEHRVNGITYDLEMHLVHAYSEYLTSMHIHENHSFTHLN